MSRPVAAPALGPSAPSPVPAPAPSARGGFAAALDGAVRALERADGKLSLPAGLEASGPRAMLALQASLYRRVEQVELASKVVDSAVTGVKTLLQTRI